MINRTRLNILNSQQAVNRLKPEEEQQLIVKLSEPLRQGISFVMQKSFRIIICLYLSQVFFSCAGGPNIFS